MTSSRGCRVCIICRKKGPSEHYLSGAVLGEPVHLTEELDPMNVNTSRNNLSMAGWAGRVYMSQRESTYTGRASELTCMERAGVGSSELDERKPENLCRNRRSCGSPIEPLLGKQVKQPQRKQPI